MTIRPGIYPNISNADYHADPALGSTSLKTLATRTPAHYAWQRDHSEHKTEFDIGTAAHSLILEQDETGIVVVDADSWRTKAAQEARDGAYAERKTPLLAKEFAEVRAMRDAVMNHPDASVGFHGHKAEQSVFWDEDGLMLKCRPDAWHPRILIDLKTSVSADPNEFRKKAYDLGYHQSAAHYIDGIRAAAGVDLPFVFVVIEKAPPYLVSVIELDAEFLDLGRAANTRAKDTYRRCLELNEWPGYEPVQPIKAPTWAV